MGYDNSGVLRPQLATQGATTKAVTALNFYTEFANPAQPDYSWSRAFKDARATFAAGDVAMYIGHASDLKMIRSINPNLNFEVALLPQIRSATYALNTSHVYGLALSRNSQNARGAITIAYLLAGENMIAPIAKTLGMSSALRRVLQQSNSAPSTNPEVSQQQNALTELVGSGPKTVEGLLNYQANISQSWPDPDPDKTSDIFRDMIESTVSGARRATEAVQRADKQLGEIQSI
jgi:ABC-type glycerol-3-phosphate transport system substrate-binding protein